jgi:AcrR family transcriptional regulator
MTDDAATSPRDISRVSIVDAAARLLREHGSRAVTTRAVAEAAGVQAPTIYRLFGDKDGLIDAVAERVMTDYVAAKKIAVENDGEPRQALRDSWMEHVGFSLENPDLFAIFNTPGRSRSSAATAEGADILRLRIRRVAAAGLLQVSEERAIGLFRSAGNGAVMTLLSMPTESRDLGLVEAMFDAVAQVAVVDVETRPQRDDLAATVAFATLVPSLPALSETERALLGEWVSRSIAASG